MTTLPNLDLFPLSGARLVPLDLIQAGQYQPRKRFDEAAMVEMTESVRNHGVMAPILLRSLPGGRFEIVAGERRFRASQRAGKDDVPAVVRELTLMQVLELQAIENIQREDLHPLEEAHSYELLMFPPDDSEGYTVEQVAEKVSKSPSHVRRRIVLNQLIPQVKEAFEGDTITLQTAQAIARMPVEIQAKAWPKILATRPSDDKPVAHKDADKILQGAYMLRLTHAAFPIKDATLVPDAGGCNVCPKRTGANPDLFGDVPEADTCTDPDCHSNKVKAHNARRKADARGKGLEVFEGKNALALLKFGPDSTALNADYVYMDEPLEELTGNKSSLHKLLGTLLTPSAVLEHPRDQTLREIVHTDKARQTLKDHGMLMHRPSKGEQAALVAPTAPKPGKSSATPAPATAKPAEADIERIKQRRVQETIWRSMVLEDVHKAMHNADAAPEPLLRAAVVDYGSGYVNNQVLWSNLAENWGWVIGQDYKRDSSPHERMHAVTEGMHAGQLALLLAELVLLPDLEGQDEELEDEAQVESLLLCSICDDPDMELNVDWRAIRAEIVVVESKKPKSRAVRTKQTPPDPTYSLPPAGDEQGAANQGVADTSTTQDNDQAPQGAQTKEEGSDLPHWVGQMVMLKGAKRVGKIKDVRENGDLLVAFAGGKDGSGEKLMTTHDVVVLPDQKMPARAPDRKRGATSVQYRNPATGETWSGRGLQPKWVQAAIASGKTLAEFEQQVA